MIRRRRAVGEAVRPSMSIKPDAHTIGVLYWLGAAESQCPESTVRAAGRICPDFPGGIDGVLWRIGQTQCRAAAPDCPIARWKAFSTRSESERCTAQRTQMEVVLISCSRRKRPGDTKEFAGFELSKIVEPRGEKQLRVGATWPDESEWSVDLT